MAKFKSSLGDPVTVKVAGCEFANCHPVSFAKERKAASASTTLTVEYVIHDEDAFNTNTIVMRETEMSQVLRDSVKYMGNNSFVTKEALNNGTIGQYNFTVDTTDAFPKHIPDISNCCCYDCTTRREVGHYSINPSRLTDITVAYPDYNSYSKRLREDFTMRTNQIDTIDGVLTQVSIAIDGVNHIVYEVTSDKTDWDTEVQESGAWKGMAREEAVDHAVSRLRSCMS